MALFLSLTVPPASAKEVAGVTLPENISVSDSAQKLVLNGAGVRKKFFFKIYVGALYLTKKNNKAQAILAEDTAAAVHMHFLYDEVSKEKLVKGWNDGFAGNLEESQLVKLKPRIEEFNKMFETVKKGDVIRLEYEPKNGTRVRFNDVTWGVIEGFDFWNALLRIWIGDSPVKEDLKQDMLGI